ncbi:MAG: sulfurtransferase TusA family protein [Oscillospiraceae bacterium]|nr:sulfurtransferase TusA family protein [Oscillospiraceae bacterium]MCD8066357.1 sulfurtransferase TusA family protein [Oscillospiraceae bacterium]MCD8191592.1 sulfurtransferase TusA family protein [Oscillospiraceae bacterium]
MIDTRGYSCPIPVIMVQKEIKKSSPAELEVLADNRAAVENITRFAGNQGYEVSAAADGSDFRLTLSKRQGSK